MGMMMRLLLLFLCFAGLRVGLGSTDPQDTAALRSLMSQWQNTPPSWGNSDDPCAIPWEGVQCTNSRVTSLRLTTMGLKGTLSGDIGQLTELQNLDLSYNSDLGGSLTPNIGNLKQLTTLILAGCSFTGTIPSQIGNLAQLYYLALNSNKFTGTIPATLGNLSNLYWLDLADNQLSGPLPISSSNSPGLDQLVNTKHFHFNKNQLSGGIPDNLFSSDMTLLHILFDGNQFNGTIPSSVGLVHSLEVLRLDKNSLSGLVPSNINNLTSIHELNLANNKLTGPMPNLTGMNVLNYVDLSNNSFAASEAPAWFSTLQSLTALMMENGGLFGEVPQKLFSLPQLQEVTFKNNQFNGTLDMGNSISQQLQTVDFQNNVISQITLSGSYNHTLILVGNPVCNNTQISNTTYCRLQQPPIPYSTSLANCSSNTCPPDQSLSPLCQCAYPYQGLMVFRSPLFRDVTNRTIFQELEMSLWMKLGLTPGSVFLQDPFWNSTDSYMQLQLKLFPSTGLYFNRSEIIRIGFALSNQTYKPPPIFGPYYFIASPYVV